jgi:hypothetical protein
MDQQNLLVKKQEFFPKQDIILGIDSASRNNILKSNNILQNLRKTGVTDLPADPDISMDLENLQRLWFASVSNLRTSLNSAHLL